MTATAPADAGALLERVATGDPLAIARAITAIENGTPAGIEVALSARGARGRCPTLGVTGPPGAGKSSLVGALIDRLRKAHPRIGVLTVDPSSPVSGGAVLGDRVRMAAHSRNPDVFIRSLAARGHLGGVTRTTRSIIDLLAAAGFDLVVVETVGTGQSEVEVAGIADVKLVVCPPGLGDDMQAIKAGVLEIADLLVVNKSDLPDAGRTAGHLKAMLHHRGHGETRAVLLASSVTGDGLDGLVDAIAARLARLASTTLPDRTGTTTSPGTLADDAAELVRAFVRHAPVDDICRAIDRGDITPHEGASRAAALFGERHGSAGMAETRGKIG